MPRKRDISGLPAEEQARIERRRQVWRESRARRTAGLPPKTHSLYRDLDALTAEQKADAERRRAIAAKHRKKRRAGDFRDGRMKDRTHLSDEARHREMNKQTRDTERKRQRRAGVSKSIDCMSCGAAVGYTVARPKRCVTCRPSYRRRAENVNARFAHRIRARLRVALKDFGLTKAGSAVRDLGCSIPELLEHLEDQFQPGMTWENYGREGWHVDHHIPLALYDLTDREQFLTACHFTNLQPRWAGDNAAKGARLEPPSMWWTPFCKTRLAKSA